MINGVNGNVYKIKSGDSLVKIAKANNTTVEALLKLNPQIKHPNLIYAGKTLVLSEAKPFAPRQDYDAKKLNLGTITINGKPVEGEFKSNFFANQKLDALGKAGDKVVISLQGGREANKNDLNAYSILNKIIANHLNNNSQIVEDNGQKRVQTQYEAITSTDLYNTMISVNGNNFDSDGNLVANDAEGNSIQIPTVGKDVNGKTYFVIINGSEKLYFDSTGQKTEFHDGAIESNIQDNERLEPIVSQNTQPKNKFEGNIEFLIPQGYDANQLNTGTVFVNGEPASIKTNANWYRNEINNFANETLNDGTHSRLDVQLKLGETMNPKYNDDSADNILKKWLGNNCDKVAIYQDRSNTEALALLRNTELYKSFVSEKVNGTNFVDGKLKTPESGFNTVQLPALEIDANGTKYYVLHTDNKVLYFNDRGESINPDL